jgi:DNA-binding response OmpR family regulator
MQYADSETTQEFAPYLERVLVLDGERASVRVLQDLLRNLGAAQVFSENSARTALNAARDFDPQIIVTEFAGSGWDGLQFVRALRRSDFSCRKAPVIMVTGEATAQAILGARDAGVHEFLRKPYTIRDFLKRIEAVTLRTRGWTEAVGYVGPDRRRFNSAEYIGPRKRKGDDSSPEAARLEQALKILRSALGAMDLDLPQALRSMRAQADDLATLAGEMNDVRLASAAVELQYTLTSAVDDRAALEAAAKPLLARLPQAA